MDEEPLAFFTRTLSPKKWAIVTTAESDSGVPRWHVELSPRMTNAIYRLPLARVQIEREGGRVEGVCSYATGKPWTYTRTIDLGPGEPLPSLVVFEYLPQRLVWVRRRLRG